MSTTDPIKKRRTTILLPELGESAKKASNTALLRMVRHLDSPITTSQVRPPKSLHQLVYTGMIVGVLSIITSFLYVIGLLCAICGLAIGIYARRRSPALRRLSAWTIGFSLAGLVISLIFVTLSIHH